MVLYVILAGIILINCAFIVTFVKDLKAHPGILKQEPGNPFIMAFTQFITFFLSTLGISDFAIGAALYPKMKWVTAKDLPGTMNAAFVLPVLAMSLAYINGIEVGLMTLFIAIAAQVIGAYLSPRIIVKLPEQTIKFFVMVGLLIAGLVILASKFGLMPVGGTATSLSGVKLVILGVAMFVFGALNNIGIGSYALTMATVYALGLDAKVAFPIMMGACAFSVPIGSIEFIKYGAYSRKITLMSATAGVVGVFVAVFVMKGMDIQALQWVVIGVILYSAASMAKELYGKKA